MLKAIPPGMTHEVVFYSVFVDGDTRTLVKRQALVLHNKAQCLVLDGSIPALDDNTIHLLTQLSDFKHYLHTGVVRRNPEHKPL